MNLIHLWGAAVAGLLDSPATSTSVMRKPSQKPSVSTSSSVYTFGGIERSSKYSFRYQIMDSVEASNSPPTPKTLWTRFCFPLLSRQTVCQNFFGSNWKSWSMAPPNSSHTGVFSLRPSELQIAWPAGPTNKPCLVSLLLHLYRPLPP